jgi:hypothetical protein
MPGAVLRRLLPARVVVSIVAAFAFVGAVVAAGALLRDRDSGAPGHPHGPTTTSPSRPTTSRGR